MLKEYSTKKKLRSCMIDYFSKVDSSILTLDEEKELARRGRNLSIPVGRKAIQNIYRPATAFEVLIGYWYLNDKERLQFFYKKFEQIEAFN